MLRKISRLSPQDRHLLVRAILLVALTRGALWLLPLAKVRRLASRRRKPLSPPASPERIAWAVRVASRYVPKATCLVQAIACQTLLNHMGLEAQLHVGVALGANEQFQAHAWVEHGGQIVIGGAESERYSTLLALD